MNCNKCRDGLYLCIYRFSYGIMPILLVYLAFFMNL